MPQVADVPKPLRNLPQNVLDALAIFRVYTGPHEQGYQAYRVHTGAIRFSWHERSVEDRLTDLQEKDWKRARPAFEWLRAAEGSAYKSFLAGHRAFLEQSAHAVAAGDMDVDEAVAWLPLRFMETVGLECAVWPHLYWEKTMTETYVRSQDARRQARNRKERRAAEEDEEDLFLQAEEEGGAVTDEEAEEEMEGAVSRQSAKASFVAKIFSPIVGFFFFSSLAERAITAVPVTALPYEAIVTSSAMPRFHQAESHNKRTQNQKTTTQHQPHPNRKPSTRVETGWPISVQYN